MAESVQTPADPRPAFEAKDIDPLLVALAGACLVVLAAVLHAVLWGVHGRLVPEAGADGASPPVVMPGEAPVAERIRAIPPPRLDPLEPLEARPPLFRSSDPVSPPLSPTQRPEDLRAERQPALQGAAWVEPGKVARIPIGVAMDAVVERERAKGGKK